MLPQDFQDAVRDLHEPLRRRGAIEYLTRQIGDFNIAFNSDGSLNTRETTEYIEMAARGHQNLRPGFEQTSFLASVVKDSWPEVRVYNPFNSNEVLEGAIDLKLGANYSRTSGELLKFLYVAHRDTALFRDIYKLFSPDASTSKQRLQTILHDEDPIRAAHELSENSPGAQGFWAYFQEQLEAGHEGRPGQPLPELRTIRWPQRFPKPDPRPMATSYTSGSVVGDVRSSVHQLVGEDKLDAALKVLERHFGGDAHQSHQVTALRGRFSRFKSDVISGGVSHENLQVERAQIVRAILNLVQ